MHKSRILDLLVSAENESMEHNSEFSLSLVRQRQNDAASKTLTSEYRPVEYKKNDDSHPIRRDSGAMTALSSHERYLRSDFRTAPFLTPVSARAESGNTFETETFTKENVQPAASSMINSAPKITRNIDFLDLPHIQFSQKRRTLTDKTTDTRIKSLSSFFSERNESAPDFAPTILTPRSKVASWSVDSFVKSPYQALAAELDAIELDHCTDAHMSMKCEEQPEYLKALIPATHMSALHGENRPTNENIEKIEQSKNYAILVSNISKASMDQLQYDVSRLELDNQALKEKIFFIMSERTHLSASAESQAQLIVRARSDLDQARDQITAMESSRAHAESQHRATIDQMQHAIGELESERMATSATAESQAQLIVRARSDLDQARDQIKAMESSRAHAESQHRATIDQMHEVICGLQSEVKESFLLSGVQSRLVSTCQLDLEHSQSKLRSFESSQNILQENFWRLGLQNHELQEENMKLNTEKKNSSIDSVAQACLAATFEQACMHIRDLGSDQECAMTNFKEVVEQMQRNIIFLEMEKSRALAQVESQASMIETAQSNLEEARLRISHLVNQQNENSDSKSIIALLQERSKELALEKDDALDRAVFVAHEMDTVKRDLMQARSQIAYLEREQHNTEMDFSAMDQMQKVINELEREKQNSLANLERIREDAAAKELKTFASFYALQRLSLQTRSSTMKNLQSQFFSVNIEPKSLPAAQADQRTRYRTQGIISEVGVRSRRQCHALSMIVPADSSSYRHLIYAYYMIAWAQFVIASKFHRQNISIQAFRLKNRSTYIISKLRRNFIVAKLFLIWKANSASLS